MNVEADKVNCNAMYSVVQYSTVHHLTFIVSYSHYYRTCRLTESQILVNHMRQVHLTQALVTAVLIPSPPSRPRFGRMTPRSSGRQKTRTTVASSDGRRRQSDCHPLYAPLAPPSSFLLFSSSFFFYFYFHF